MSTKWDGKAIALAALTGLGIAALFILVFVGMWIFLIYFNLMVLKYVIYPLTPIKYVSNQIVYLVTFIEISLWSISRKIDDLKEDE